MLPTFFVRPKKIRPGAPSLTGFPSPLGSSGLRVNSHDPLRGHVLEHTRRTPPALPARLGGAQGMHGFVCASALLVFAASVAYATLAYTFSAVRFAALRELYALASGSFVQAYLLCPRAGVCPKETSEPRKSRRPKRLLLTRTTQVRHSWLSAFVALLGDVCVPIVVILLALNGTLARKRMNGKAIRKLKNGNTVRLQRHLQ